MAEIVNIGSLVQITIQGTRTTGQIIALDPETELLMLKINPPGQTSVSLHLVNLRYVQAMQVIREVDASPPSPICALNVSKIHERLHRSLEERRRQLSYVGAHTSREGQMLFNTIVRTIEDARWDGPNIVVLEEVTVCPPYGTENCHCSSLQSQALKHIKKIVEKFRRDNSAIFASPPGAPTVPGSPSLPQ